MNFVWVLKKKSGILRNYKLHSFCLSLDLETARTELCITYLLHILLMILHSLHRYSEKKKLTKGIYFSHILGIYMYHNVLNQLVCKAVQPKIYYGKRTVEVSKAGSTLALNLTSYWSSWVNSREYDSDLKKQFTLIVQIKVNVVQNTKLGSPKRQQNQTNCKDFKDLFQKFLIQSWGSQHIKLLIVYLSNIFLLNSNVSCT